jgi:hypothetical protein
MVPYGFLKSHRRNDLDDLGNLKRIKLATLPFFGSFGAVAIRTRCRLVIKADAAARRLPFTTTLLLLIKSGAGSEDRFLSSVGQKTDDVRDHER